MCVPPTFHSPHPASRIPVFLAPRALCAQIDPNRTISAGKVDIGAFRTYPENYTPPAGAGESEYQSIPLSKIEDFGVHANQYYPLDVQIFTSSLDTELLGLLWNKYWVNTLSQSPLISVSGFFGLGMMGEGLMVGVGVRIGRMRWLSFRICTRSCPRRSLRSLQHGRLCPWRRRTTKLAKAR